MCTQIAFTNTCRALQKSIFKQHPVHFTLILTVLMGGIFLLPKTKFTKIYWCPCIMYSLNNLNLKTIDYYTET